MTQERVAYVNGEIVPESRASVSISDRGFILGDAVFDTTRTFGHEIFRLDEHLDRLYESLKWMRIDPQMPKDEMAGLTMDVLERNLPTVEERDDIWVTQRVTRGLRLAGGDNPVCGGPAHRHHRVLPHPVQGARALLPRRYAHHHAVRPAHAARRDESQSEDAQLHQPDTGRHGGACPGPERLRHSPRHERQPVRGQRQQYLRRQGRRHPHAQEPVRARRHQPSDDGGLWPTSLASRRPRRTSTCSTPTRRTRYS